MQQQETVFPDGFRVFHPHPNAVQFGMKGEVVINLAQFYAWAQQHVDERGDVRITICTSKDGEKLYGKKNDWRPQQRQPQVPPPQQQAYQPPPQAYQPPPQQPQQYPQTQSYGGHTVQADALQGLDNTQPPF